MVAVSTAGASAATPGRVPRRRAVPVWIWAPIGALIVVIAGACAFWLAIPGPSSESAANGVPRVGTGSVAASFQLPNLTPGGPPVSLAAYRGKPVMVNFFASWCPNCQAEMRAFAATEGSQGSRLAIIGVDVNDTSAAAARRMLAIGGDHYAVGTAPANGAVVQDYRVVALPTTVLIDRQGRVAGELFGAQTPSSLARWARRLGA